MIFTGVASAGVMLDLVAIEILGDRVGLFADARVDASGQTAGGQVLIGGDFQGKGDTQTANQTQVGKNASIHVDAIESGDGGKAIVWADGYTQFDGVTARGGSSAGDGIYRGIG